MAFAVKPVVGYIGTALSLTFVGGRSILFQKGLPYMLPHIGSATRKIRDVMGNRALDNLDAFYARLTPRDLL